MVTLAELGFSPSLLAEISAQDGQPGRIIEEQREAYRVLTDGGTFWAKAAGKLVHEVSEGRGEMPSIGDFVLLRPTNLNQDDDMF